MRYISVCSGIEAATVAWHSLGWEPVAFAEIDAFPSAVLAHHFPTVPNLGDISKVDWSPYHGTVDLVVGGTPCQSFSIAGKREGLDGASGLVFEYFRLLSEVRPKWFVWENVPGSFSSNKGADFQSILREWDKLGYHVAWRVLDAQFFGVPQRRRRIFAVGHLGDWRYSAKVLFEPDCLRRDTSKSGKARKSSAASAESRTGVFTKQRIGEYADCGKASTCSARDYKDATDLVVGTLAASGAGTSRPAGQGNELDFLVPTLSPTMLRMRSGCEGGGKGALLSEDRSLTLATGNDQILFEPTVELMPRMAVRRLTPTECERLQGFPTIIHLEVETMTTDEIAICAILNGDIRVDCESGIVWGNRGPGGRKLSSPRQLGFTHPSGYKIVHLSANNEKKAVRIHRLVWIAKHGVIPEGYIVDHINNDKEDNRISNLQLLTSAENSTKAASDGRYNMEPHTKLSAEVRTTLYHEYVSGKGTYRELAERYGISKSRVGQIIKEHDYTDIPWRGKDHAPDGPRYKALGNSMAVPCMRWIGERIQSVGGGMHETRLHHAPPHSPLLPRTRG